MTEKNHKKIITLTTDFGHGDAYVGVMKGVIFSLAPSANIIDLSHQISAQNILQAAYLIQANYRYFPQGTIHLVVVDPEVGSQRKIILLLHDSHLFLAPDNGILSLLLQKKTQQKAYFVDSPALYLQPVSQTFHGRDIFAPVAAHLASGNDPANIGPEVGLEELTTLCLPDVTIDRTTHQIIGAIINIDHFGNIITNITIEKIAQLSPNLHKVHATIGQYTFQTMQKNYSSVAPGQTIMIINSTDSLEIAINQGNAATKYKACINDKVTLSIC